MAQRVHLRTALPRYGYAAGPDSFRSLIRDLYRSQDPTGNPDNLVCNPPAALAFADEVRREVGVPDLPTDLILRTLINLRREAALPAADDFARN